MEALSKGKLDVMKKIWMTIARTKMTSVDIGKAGRKWILGGLAEDDLEKNHGAIRKLNVVPAAQERTAKKTQNKKAKKKKEAKARQKSGVN